jgi:hypothetical protein
LTKVLKTYVGEKTAYLINGVKKTGYPHVEDWNYIPVPHPVPKSIQNSLNILMEDLQT